MDLAISNIASLLRILATLGIFIYHFTKLSGNNVRGLDFISILIFCFLTGYLSVGIRSQPLTWLIRRIFSIMLPYWFVIIPLLCINRIISYKETSMAMDLITILGGNLFLNNPVYIMAWYITFVLLLYIFVFVQSMAKNVIQLLLIWVSAILFGELVLHMLDYFMAFSFGLIFSIIHHPPQKSVSQKNYMGKILFFLQDKCYSFFLIHGAVLLLLFNSNFLNNKFFIFIFGFLFSGFSAVFLRKITQPLIVILVNKTESTILFKTFLPRILRTM